MNKRYLRLAFTGGPCSGKTESIQYIKDFYSSPGSDVEVLAVPEAAQQLISSGLVYEGNVSKGVFQQMCLQLQLSWYSSVHHYTKEFLKQKRGPETLLILFDRSFIDHQIYLENYWQAEVLYGINKIQTELIPVYYDGLIHMESAAVMDDFEIPNSERLESRIEQMRALEQKARLISSKYKSEFIGAEKDFHSKIEAAFNCVNCFLGSMYSSDKETAHCEKVRILR